MADPVIYCAQDLLALAQSGASMAEFSPLGDSPYLLLEAAPELSETDGRILTAWLRRLPCPVIGLAEDAMQDAIIDACDTRVADVTAAAPLLKTIHQVPNASAIFVQLLRITENMPLEDALDAESLAYATLQSGAEYQRWLLANRAEAIFQPTDSGPPVLVERHNNIVKLQLNRASNRNAMSVEMRDALNEALQGLLLDSSIKSVEIRGAGRCFSVGGDLTEFGSVPDPVTGHIVRSLSVPGRLLSRCAAKTTVYVQGACIGSGIEFPAFAGRIVAAGNSHFQLPEIGMGLIPGAGGCISIARRMGRQRTAWLGLSGKRLRAGQALEWGLVDALAD